MNPRLSHLIESVLFVSANPVSPQDLASATGLSVQEVQDALAELDSRHSPESSGIVLRNVAGGYQLATNPACAAAVERFREELRPTSLSNAAHEVLSCALYLGPLTRAAVSAARGVNSDAVVRSLLERGLLVEAGSDKSAPGTPAFLTVTQEFLSATGAASREDFPPLETLVSPEELDLLRQRLEKAREAPAEAPASPEGA